MPLPDTTREFLYETEGLSYRVVIGLGDDGNYHATITILEGQADINAVYWGDDDSSGPSASLPGPLNMNGGGAQFEGEPVQWDGAQALSKPGLGKAGTGKETFLQEGESLQVELDIDSLDEVEFFGIRATSTSTPAGSIKGVSQAEPDDECDDDECEDCDTPVRDDYPDLPDATTGVTFGVDILGEGKVNEFVYIAKSDLDVEGTPTFADYVAALDARLETEDEPCEAKPVKAIIYTPDEPAAYYYFGADGVTYDLFNTAADDGLLPSVDVAEEAPEDDEEDMMAAVA